MDKEKILEKSRKENKNQDIYEKEVLKDGGNIAAVVAAALATIFFIIQILLGEGMNYGLYAVVVSIPAAKFTIKAVRMKRRHETVVAIVYDLMTLAISAAHIYQMFSESTIL